MSLNSECWNVQSVIGVKKWENQNKKVYSYKHLVTFFFCITWSSEANIASKIIEVYDHQLAAYKLNAYKKQLIK